MSTALLAISDNVSIWNSKKSSLKSKNRNVLLLEHGLCLLTLTVLSGNEVNSQVKKEKESAVSSSDLLPQTQPLKKKNEKTKNKTRLH